STGRGNQRGSSPSRQASRDQAVTDRAEGAVEDGSNPRPRAGEPAQPMGEIRTDRQPSLPRLVGAGVLLKEGLEEGRVAVQTGFLRQFLEIRNAPVEGIEARNDLFPDNLQDVGRSYLGFEVDWIRLG